MDSSKIIVEETLANVPLHNLTGNYSVNLPTNDQGMSGSMGGYPSVGINPAFSSVLSLGAPPMTLTAIINELQNENRDPSGVSMQEIENREFLAEELAMQSQLQAQEQKRECIASECLLEPRKGSQLCEKHSKQRSRGKTFELKPGNTLKKRGRPPKPIEQCKAKKQKKYYLRKKLQSLGESLETIADVCNEEKPTEMAPKEEVLRKIGENVIHYFKSLPANSSVRNELIYAVCDGIPQVDVTNVFGVTRKLSPRGEKHSPESNNNSTVTTTLTTTPTTPTPAVQLFPEAHSALNLSIPSLQALHHNMQNLQNIQLQNLANFQSLQSLPPMPQMTMGLNITPQDLSKQTSSQQQ